MTCEIGVLNAECTHCECDQTITVRVLSNIGQTLPNVTVAHLSSPTTVLDTSTISGHVTLQSTCAGHSFVLQRSGFLSLEFEVGTTNEFDVEMQRIGAEFYPITTKLTFYHVIKYISPCFVENLEISVQPEDKFAVSGMNVTLCCEAHGQPAAMTYQWLVTILVT